MPRIASASPGRKAGVVKRTASMLSEFLTTHRETIIAKSRAKVASRAAPRATPIELKTGVPLFLDQLIATLRIERIDK